MGLRARGIPSARAWTGSSSTHTSHVPPGARRQARSSIKRQTRSKSVRTGSTWRMYRSGSATSRTVAWPSAMYQPRTVTNSGWSICQRERSFPTVLRISALFVSSLPSLSFLSLPIAARRSLLSFSRLSSPCLASSAGLPRASKAPTQSELPQQDSGVNRSSVEHLSGPREEKAIDMSFDADFRADTSPCDRAALRSLLPTHTLHIFLSLPSLSADPPVYCQACDHVASQQCHTCRL